MEKLFDPNGVLSGSRTYFVSAAGAFTSAAGWINNQLLPLIDGQLSVGQFIDASGEPLTALFGFLGLGYLRSALKKATGK